MITEIDPSIPWWKQTHPDKISAEARETPIIPETCDRCGPAVLAMVEVIMPVTEDRLTLCGHHARKLPDSYVLNMINVPEPSADDDTADDEIETITDTLEGV